MAFNYASIRKLASQQILMFGQAMTLSRPVSSYDPTTGYVDAAAAANYDVTGIMTKNIKIKRPKGSVLAQDRWVLLEAENLKIIPAESDLLVIAGETWSIVYLEEISPGGTALLYLVQVRK